MAPPRKYLQVDEWTKFLTNDHAHVVLDIAGLKKDVHWIKWVVGIGLSGTIALLATTLGIIIVHFF